MSINKLVLQLYRAVGILSIFILLTSGGSFAQVIDFPLQDDKSAKLLLRNIMVLGEEKYIDPLGDKKAYFLGIEFGRKKFEVEVYNAKTGELIRKDLTIIGQNYFTKVTATDKEEKYKMSKNGIDYTVSFGEIKPSYQPDKRTITLWVEVRDTVKKIFMYRASDVMYIPY